MLKERDVDPGYLLCPECEGAQQVEVQRCPNEHRPMSQCCGGHTAWVDCEECNGAGQVEDDRPECEWCGDHTDEEKLVEMPGGRFYCPSCAEAQSD